MKKAIMNRMDYLNLLVICLLLFSSNEVRAQKMKTKKLSKQERKLQKYNIQRQAMIDTSFAVYTNTIKAPYVSSSTITDGILRVVQNEVFVDEIDWVGPGSSKVRIHDIVMPLNYIFVQEGENSSRVMIETKLKGETYFFNIQNSLEDGVELQITNSKGHKVIYDGTMKLLKN